MIILSSFFLFNQGYSANNRLDFILTVVKRDYNTNDLLKFILSIIWRDNGLNKRLKHVKNGRKENRKWTKWKWKLTKQEMNWKSRIRKTYRLKNEERMKNGGDVEKYSRNHSRKCYGSVTETLRLDFSSRKRIFSSKIAEMHSLRVMKPFETAPSPIYREKRRCLPPRGFLRKISEHTQITKFTPPFCTLRKSYGSVSDLIFLFFSFPFHQY